MRAQAVGLVLVTMLLVGCVSADTDRGARRPDAGDYTSSGTAALRRVDPFAEGLEVWREVIRMYPGQDYSTEFADGFIQGYGRRLQGNGERPQGFIDAQKMEDFRAGFDYGVLVADARRQRISTSSSSPVTAPSPDRAYSPLFQSARPDPKPLAQEGASDSQKIAVAPAPRLLERIAPVKPTKAAQEPEILPASHTTAPNSVRIPIPSVQPLYEPDNRHLPAPYEVRPTQVAPYPTSVAPFPVYEHR